MDEIVFEQFGAEILLHDGRYYVRCDAGGIDVRMKELPITAADAERARSSEQDAYEVILSAEQADRTGVRSCL